MGIAAHSSQHFKSHALADGIHVLLGNTSSALLLFGAIRLHGCCRWRQLNNMLSGVFIAVDITRLHGSHRQSRFSCSFVGVGRSSTVVLVVRVTSASVMLWWVWDGSSSLAICRVACSFVVDDAAIAHVSTVEWAFWELSATDILFAWRKIKEIFPQLRAKLLCCLFLYVELSAIENLLAPRRNWKGLMTRSAKNTFLNYHLTLGNSNLEEGSSKKFE
eukprot:scaffold5695_cov168-Skeletonema_dohrnii-CCMP3373.AAC.3